MFFHQYYATDDIGSHFPRRLSNGNNFLHSTWGMNRARQLSAMGQRRLGPPPQSSLAHRGELAGAMDPGSGTSPYAGVHHTHQLSAMGQRFINISYISKV